MPTGAPFRSRFREETNIPTYKWSVRSYKQCELGIAKVEAELGDISVLVNNAGITKDGMFHKMTSEMWHDVIDTNLNGLFNMTHPIWKGMRERGFGRIINLSSINGQKGALGQVNYSSSKSGEIFLIHHTPAPSVCGESRKTPNALSAIRDRER